MTAIEQIPQDEQAPDVPEWMKPVLDREVRDRKASDTKRDHEGVRRVLAIDERLAELGIEPLKPAEWSPSANQLRHAVLLEPGDAGSDYRVEAGWEGGDDGHVALYVYDYCDTRGRWYVGPLNTVEQAAAARFAPAPQAEPVDHAAEAADHLARAARASGDHLDTFQGALIDAQCAQAHATLALEETLSRIGARAALRHLARRLAAADTANDGQAEAEAERGQERREGNLLLAVFPEMAAPPSRNEALAAGHRVAGNLLAVLPSLPAVNAIAVTWAEETRRLKLVVTLASQPGGDDAMQAVLDWVAFLGDPEGALEHNSPVRIVGHAQYCGVTVEVWCWHSQPSAAGHE
jgi:hypothetical protein